MSFQASEKKKKIVKFESKKLPFGNAAFVCRLWPLVSDAACRLLDQVDRNEMSLNSGQYLKGLILITLASLNFSSLAKMKLKDSPLTLQVNCDATWRPGVLAGF